MNVLTQEYIKSVLNYDPLSGDFFWTKNAYINVIGKKAGCINKDGYWQIRLNNKTYLSHRLAYLYVNGSMPKDMIDHINGIRSDNRICNLRDADSTVNNQNMRAKHKDSQSKYLGVFKNKTCKTSVAFIGVNGKQLYLGSFPTEELAHEAYLTAKRKLHPACTI